MTNKDSQESNGQPNLSGSNGGQPTRSKSNDARNYTTKRAGFSDGKRNARTTSQNPGDVRQRYGCAHLLNIHDTQTSISNMINLRAIILALPQDVADLKACFHYIRCSLHNVKFDL
jgi:hypothetical protein